MLPPGTPRRSARGVRRRLSGCRERCCACECSSSFPLIVPCSQRGGEYVPAGLETSFGWIHDGGFRRDWLCHSYGAIAIAVHEFHRGGGTRLGRTRSASVRTAAALGGAGWNACRGTCPPNEASKR